MQTLERLLAEVWGGAPISLTPLAGGTVNRVWRIDRGDEAFVLRIAPSDAEADAGPSWLTSRGLRRELAAIALLAELREVLPETIHADLSREVIASDWVVQRLVPGHAWSEVDASLTADQRVDLWRQTGALCRRIHAVTSPTFGPAGEAMFARWSDLLVHDAAGFVADADRFALDPALMTRLADAIAYHRATLDLVTTGSLIHSDLGPRHLFVAPDADGRFTITGVIDLEFARFADPMSESVIELFGMLPHDPAHEAAFWKGYGSRAAIPGEDIRATLHEAIVLGWTLSDVARLGQRDQIASLAGELIARLDRLDATG